MKHDCVNYLDTCCMKCIDIGKKNLIKKVSKYIRNFLGKKNEILNAIADGIERTLKEF